MKKGRKAIIVVLLWIFQHGVEAVEPVGPDNEAIQRIDGLYELAMRENYRAGGLDLMKESLDLCMKHLDANQASHELLWRCARSAVELGETSKILQTRDWKTLCASMSWRGIGWTDMAKRIAPDRVEGYFWQMKAMGLIYEAEGAVSFIAKGLAPKSRQNLDACYSIDRSYMDFTPVLAMALYLHTIPLLFGRDIAKALVYYDEYAANSHWSFESWRQYPSAAELLMSTKKPEDTAKARTLIRAALADPTPRLFYFELARSLLVKIERSSH
ncbi:MAG: hypothetical protein Q8O15_10385 [Rectinemataceae bacterium]|nr:hypothetical protein [Rectinemataceae bacterium]